MDKVQQHIQTVEKALGRATKGQWLYEDMDNGGQVTTDQKVAGYFNLDHWICQLWFKDETPMNNHVANGYLISNSPTWLHTSIELLEQQQREIDKLKQVMDFASDLLSHDHKVYRILQDALSPNKEVSTDVQEAPNTDTR